MTIQDDEIVAEQDLCGNFYCRENHVGKVTRAEASINQLQELNQYVDVTVHSGEITTDFVKNFDVVVLTHCYDMDLLFKINEFCRSQEKPIGFIWAGQLGLYGFCFVDFGDNHLIFDRDGERCLSAIVTSISQDEEGVVTVSDNKRHGFQDDDFITFKEVQGMTEVNDQNFKIKVLSPYSFSIGDTSKFGAYTREGTAQQVKVPFKLSFRSLKATLKEPINMDVPGDMMHDPNMDFEDMNKPYKLHLILRAILDFYHSKKRLPSLLNEEDSKTIIGIVSHKVQEIKGKKSKWEEEHKDDEEKPKEPSMFRLEEVQEDLIKNVAQFAETETAPFSSFWGGIAAQEVVKFTGKFTPLRQWLHYQVYDACLPEGEVKREGYKGSRFRDQIVLFGNEAFDKMRNAKLFMVGAGAIGCEYLKQFGLTGVASGEHGSLTVTDDDNIEVSNLNRQFLFRREHVKKSKAEVACGVAKDINPELKVFPHKGRAEPGTEHIFTDVFWDDLDVIFGAVDNIHAREYIDSKVVLHNKYYIESGTLGTKCNSQIIIPHKTQSYSDSRDQKEESIPMCTLRNYPYLLDHTIEWARDYFQALFGNGSADFKNLVKDPKGYVKQCIEEANKQAGGILDKFKFLSKFLIAWPEINTQALVNIGRQLFQDIFHDQIAQLLYCFPIDFKDENGHLFWSSPKRPPYVIDFDADDSMHFMFIKSVVVILSDVFGAKLTENDEEIREMARNAPFTVTNPQKKTIKQGDNDEAPECGDDDDTVLEGLVYILIKLIYFRLKN